MSRLIFGHRFLIFEELCVEACVLEILLFEFAQPLAVECSFEMFQSQSIIEDIGWVELAVSILDVACSQLYHQSPGAVVSWTMTPVQHTLDQLER